MYAELDKVKDECGVFGIFAPHQDVAKLTYYGLYALQHRGQESAGIATTNGSDIQLHKNMGLVTEVFTEDSLSKLHGDIAIGHVRYSTTGSSLLINAQPLSFRYSRGKVALAHNGNLTNANELRNSLGATGSVFQSTTDSEVIVNLIARYGQNPIEEALMKCMIDIKGAYSLLVMTEDKLIGVRDPYGVRPLCIGKVDGGYVLASETCALDTVGADFLRDVEPGEIVIIDKNGINSINNLRGARRALCIFEFVYLARPDSNIDGQNVVVTRRQFGRQLAKECKIDADIVIPVPDSGTAAAVGYAEESGIPFEEGLMKNRYVGRTFIQPSQEMRDLAVRLKLNPVRSVLEGKRVIMVDDSIVRGTTSRKIVQMLRKAGVKEVHMLVSSSPILHPCYYGIDTSARAELIAAQYDLDEIREHIGADSLHYLSLEGMLKSAGQEPGFFCNACFSGKYPIEIPDFEHMSKYVMETGGNYA
ncbi:amidophosphoribosyltransferase [Metallumcola ferriviriculae]|uniref:Amidophosphoribosyltransferase n=1 Tax=Metallumcola ferriviriculae TaxID=3039180 RepID=A0AAU0UT46_9FIRM|nr:amidophosphoribosyltransferase [Desulfitibacteraceae bacterium MK1]